MFARAEVLVANRKVVHYGIRLLIITLLGLMVNSCFFSKRLKRVQTYPEWSQEIRHMTVGDKYVLASAGKDGLILLNTTNPAATRKVGWRIPIDVVVRTTININNHCVYVIGSNTLYVVDISNLSNPVILGLYKPDTRAIEVEVQEGYAFLPTGDGGLQVIDTSDPTSLKKVGVYDSNVVGSKITVWHIAISGQYAYISLTDSIGGDFIESLDISEPTRPHKIGSIRLDLAGEIVIRGDYAFVTNGIGLQILDISNPSSPTVIASYDTPNLAQGLKIEGNYVYINDLFGVEVVDISNPRSPHRVAYTKLPQVQDIAVVDGYIYVADTELGLVIYERP